MPHCVSLTNNGSSLNRILTRASNRTARIPIVVWLFILEGLFCQSRLPFVRLSFAMHMIVTAVFFAFFTAWWFFLPRRTVYTELGAIAHETGNITSIRVFAALLIAWGGISCVLQPDVFSNLLFWLMWSGNIFVAFWVIPRLLTGITLEQVVKLLSIVLLLCVVGSLLVQGQASELQGRLGGMFGNPTVVARFLALAIVFWLARFIADRKAPLWVLVMIPIAGTLLVMTRTRASIAACLLGILLVVACVAMGRVGIRNVFFSKGRMFVLMAIAVVGLIYVLFSGMLTDKHFESYLRLEGGPVAVYQARSMNWERAFEDIPEYGPFGWGFLSKYGSSTNRHTIAGVSIPAYDWTTAADPLNMVVLASQQIGIPGGLLLLALLFLMLRAAWKSGNLYALGILGCGLVFGLLDGNWLLSFGDTVDRFSVVAIGALLMRPGIDTSP